jgi:hypothetical protein
VTVKSRVADILQKKSSCKATTTYSGKANNKLSPSNVNPSSGEAQMYRAST